MKVLVIDDDPSILIMASKSLEKFNNFDVEEAQTIDEAITQITNKQFDVILSDFYLEEATGEDVIDEVKKMNLFEDLPVIFLTGKTDEESIESFFKMGVKGVITKPFLPKDLGTQIEEILNSVSS